MEDLDKKTYKPHPDFQKLDAGERKKWADALRSGKYTQGSHTLHDGNGSYCCLGVLQVINGRSVDGSLPSNTDEPVEIGDYLPESINLAYGATPNDRGHHCDNTPSVLNDLAGLTFPQIADLIEGKEVIVS